MGHAFHLMRRLEMSCETQVLAQSGGAKLIFPPMDVVRKTGAQTTQLVQKKEKDTSDGPAIMWAAVRRWMEQIDPGYMH
jgi:ribulose-5-phosphate 4-epimerase/fuculose-1-phosphate aldolase